VTVRLARVVIMDLRRNLGHLALAAVGVVLGVATFVFLIALASGVEHVLLGQVFPIERFEVVRSRIQLDVWALRVGVGGETLGPDDLEAIAAVPGVAAVYPKMQLLVPAVMTAGRSLLGVDIATEVVADGIDPALVAEDIAAGHRFADPLDGVLGSDDDVPCGVSLPCAEGMYCSELEGRCKHYIPAIVSRHLVELYNGSMRRSHDLPEINPDVAVGLTAELRLGASMFGLSARRGVVEERLRLVGFSDKAIPVGVTLPLATVQRFNTRFRSEETARQFHSAIVEVASRQDLAAVTRQVQQLGLEVVDRGAERAALLIAVLMLVSSLVSGAILVVAAIHIMHAFSMLIAQRRREIGLMRAVGASRTDLRRVLLGEAAVVGSVAGGAGILLARVAMVMADLLADRLIPPFPYRPETFFHLSPGLVLGAVALATVCCVLGAAVPAHRAAMRDAAEVLSGH
jgi:ABC-type antimicrobial peptide transport system permease subunit